MKHTFSVLVPLCLALYLATFISWLILGEREIYPEPLDPPYAESSSGSHSDKEHGSSSSDADSSHGNVSSSSAEFSSSSVYIPEFKPGEHYHVSSASGQVTANQEGQIIAETNERLVFKVSGIKAVFKTHNGSNIVINIKNYSNRTIDFDTRTDCGEETAVEIKPEGVSFGGAADGGLSWREDQSIPNGAEAEILVPRMQYASVVLQQGSGETDIRGITSEGFGFTVCEGALKAQTGELSPNKITATVGNGRAEISGTACEKYSFLVNGGSLTASGLKGQGNIDINGGQASVSVEENIGATLSGEINDGAVEVNINGEDRTVYEIEGKMIFGRGKCLIDAKINSGKLVIN